MMEVLVIGAGIAGAGVAAALGSRAKVTILEAEAQPGYHSTGRSAAFWHESYGGPAVQPLTTASRQALVKAGVLSSRGALYVALAEEVHRLDTLLADFAGSGVAFERLDGDAARARFPYLSDQVAGAVWEASCHDIDVGELHRQYLAAAKAAGARLTCDAGVERLERHNGRWRAFYGAQTVDADVVVNAAGGWASEIARLAGASDIAIQPMRRTIAQVRVAETVGEGVPLVIDVAGSFYTKPAGGRLWVSPHDETPTPPCDAAAEEIDVALAIDRLEAFTDFSVRTVESRWAGLRSFAPDRVPVYGFDPVATGFFWCAGQGGFGIQTAPAASAMSAALILGEAPPIDAAPFSPARFG